MRRVASTPLAANQARNHSTQEKLVRIDTALGAMRRERAAITYPAVARRTGVSRTFLYQNAAAKDLVVTAIAASGDERRRAQTVHDAQVEASWQQRAPNAEDAPKTAYTEIGIQRERIGILLGQIRDLRAEYADGTAQRIAAENITLKQHLRQLTEGLPAPRAETASRPVQQPFPRQTPRRPRSRTARRQAEPPDKRPSAFLSPTDAGRTTPGHDARRDVWPPCVTRICGCSRPGSVRVLGWDRHTPSTPATESVRRDQGPWRVRYLARWSDAQRRA
ncbi:hypothetical protein GCM10022255_094910 [Dactylosporangium darangshiense]|uniref:Transposase n=1 Tax=Dactylosporangium darangshiense TaxID=579108 RepID=A0ABP8DQW4_9ACTN